MMALSSLRVSETFYSLQGEGPSVGVPAVFLRLSGCNLLCESADWRCDTIEVWRQGETKLFSEILAQWRQQGWEKHLVAGAHLVVTGGEPLLQDIGIDSFLRFLSVTLNVTPFVEIETNGTKVPSEVLISQISQFNVSPKLSNSGMPESRRIVPDAMQCFATNPQAIFKIVVAKPADIVELQETLIQPYRIPSQRVFLMPAAANRQILQAQFPWVAEACKENGYRLSTRLQLEIWDQATGV